MWLAVWSAEALAQNYVCPNGPGPGEVQVGVTGGSHGIAAMPVCESLGGYEDYEDYDDTDDTDGEPSYDPVQAQIDAQQAWLALATLAAEDAARAAEAQAALDADPRFRALRDGTWEHTSDAGPGGSRRCGAFYATLTGGVAIAGQTGDPAGTFLTFLGPAIPTPPTTRKVKATLEQTDSAPQTVRAFVHAAPGGFGALTFAVPVDIAALPPLLLDQQSFVVRVKRAVVFELGWHDGRAAADQLSACAGG